MKKSMNSFDSIQTNRIESSKDGERDYRGGFRWRDVDS